MEMNTEQKKAIELVDGQLVIVACPGSGKTTTLLHRIHYMITKKQIPAGQILMLTFTKAAADEMKSRYYRDFDSNTKATFCTIHSFCLALLCKFTDFKTSRGIISDNDATTFFMKRLEKASNIGNKLDFINDLKLDISILKVNRFSEETYQPKCCKDKKVFQRLYRAYEEQKNTASVIDYDDMLLMAYDLMQSNKKVLSWVRSTFRYIMVDEYQDVNRLQKDIIYYMAGENGNLAVVGDDDQAIYGFRGATPDIMLAFQRDYPGARLLQLGINYRSGREIVAHAAKLISINKNRYQKDFKAFRKTMGVVVERGFQNREKEMSFLVTEVKKLCREGMNLNDIAVIYRTNKQATLIAKSFFDASIPIVSKDMISCVFDHWIYKDILAFYRMAMDKGNKADFLQTLNHPNRFLYGTDLIKEGPNEEYMLARLEESRDEEWKVNAAKEQVEDYFWLLEQLGRTKTPQKFLHVLYTTGEYRKYLKEYSEFRNEDLNELTQVWEELYRSTDEITSWEEWSRSAVVDRTQLNEAMMAKSGVCLTTMHGAKGLEWKIVYIMDCVEGKCPYQKAKKADELEEERRLFYVAMTRAKDQLYLLRSYSDGNNALIVSPYLKESGVVTGRI